MLITQSTSWIITNILLAMIPVALGYTIAFLSHCRPKFLARGAMLILGIAWLVFLPNACYLLTEWRHFFHVLDSSNLYLQWRMGKDIDVMLKLMMYTIFYLCYSGIGLLAFAIAIRPIARIIKRTGASLSFWAVPFFLLMSLGMYLGLILRYNTWDLIYKHNEILNTVLNLATKTRLSAFLIFFAGFLWLVYLATDIWIDGFLYRVKGSLSCEADTNKT